MGEAISLIVGSIFTLAVAHVYYRGRNADLTARFDSLQRQFDGLQPVVQQAVDRGLVTAERTPTGEIKALGPPSPPTGFSLS
jgi:hypothetical protein